MPENTQLVSPPITEVACAFVFDRQLIDTMDFGVYWESKRDKYPTTQIHPAIVNVNSGFQVGGAIPLRSWLISQDDSVVIQLQSDRFVFNWRLRDGGGSYPGFNNWVLSHALKEFHEFCDWISIRTKSPVSLKRIELTKINELAKGDQYSSTAQLVEILSVARVFSDIHTSDPQLLQLRLSETHTEGAINLIVGINTESVRVETQCSSPVTVDPRKVFVAANSRLNKVFFRLFKDGLHVFGGAQ